MFYKINYVRQNQESQIESELSAINHINGFVSYFMSFLNNCFLHLRYGLDFDWQPMDPDDITTKTIKILNVEIKARINKLRGFHFV